MKKLVLQTSIFGLIGFVALYVYGYFFMVTLWDCEVRKEIKTHQAYLDKIASTYKNENYFWAWMSYEGFLPKDRALPSDKACSKEVEGEKANWLWSSFWSTVLPSQYAQFQTKISQVTAFNLFVHDKISDYEKRREDWWFKLSYDIKKLCALTGQIKRLKEVREHLLLSCRLPASSSPVNSCLSEIKNMEELISREEKPLVENQEKMKMKWPYLPEEISCE